MAGTGDELKKDLNVWHLFAIAVAPTLSSGFFLLPGLVYADAGPAIIGSYALAVILVIPALMCKVELTTAMPKAGGVYFFLDRSLGPWVGTISGIGTWLVMTLKTAFALVGVGAYLGVIWPDLPVLAITAGLAAAFALLNLVGVKASGEFQIYLVVALLLALAWFMGGGAFQIESGHFTNFFREGANAMVATAGAVFISFAGMTKVASIAEEVEEPEKAIPRSVFGALATTAVIYIGGMTVMIGVLEPGEIAENPAPVATAAEAATGSRWGLYAVIGAALMGFLGTANAGIMSGSRYPLAMSRDHLMPTFFGRLNEKNVPTISVLVTGAMVAATIVFFEPQKIAKLGGVFKMILFGLMCLAVLVMRESTIDGYDPGYRTPLYPWLPIAGILTPLWIIGEMGLESILFAAGLIVASALWYSWYAEDQVSRQGALYHVFHRWGRYRDRELGAEFREIVQEKGPRETDPIGEVVASARVIDFDEEPDLETLIRIAATKLTDTMEDRRDLENRFLEAYENGFQPVSSGVAIPHVRLEDLHRPRMALIRVRRGIPSAEGADEPVYALLFLISPDDAANQHLRILAYLAEQIQQEDFLEKWQACENEQELKEFFLRENRFLPIRITETGPTSSLAGRRISQLDWPTGVLVGMIQRNGDVLVPNEHTRLQVGDRLTLTGDPGDLNALKARGLTDENGQP